MSSLYHDDLHAWAELQAKLLREGEIRDVDLEHVAEEMESLAASERGELRNRLTVLLCHLLKWQHQPSFRGPSWRLTISEQRVQLVNLLDDNPSLRPRFAEILRKSYRAARLRAERETGLGEQNFPFDCPYTADQVLADTFFPGAP